MNYASGGRAAESPGMIQDARHQNISIRSYPASWSGWKKGARKLEKLHATLSQVAPFAKKNV
jgi:hypothetical protein